MLSNARPFHFLFMFLFGLLFIFLMSATATATSSSQRGIAYKADKPLTIDLSQLSPDMQTAISKKFSISSSSPISLKKLKEIILFIMKSPQYYDVEIFKDNERNVFFMKAFSRAHWENINITGIKKIKINEIKGLISDTLVKKNHIGLIKKVKKIYEDKGYFHVSIKIELSNNVLNVKIQEGKRSQISAIHFSSENQKLNTLLEKSLKKYHKAPLNKENKKKIKKKIENIAYKNNYFKLKYELSISHKNNSAKLKYKLSKVDKFNISFYGNRKILSSSLMSVLNIKKYRFSYLNPDKDLKMRLKKIYMERGYPFVSIDSNLVKKEKYEMQFKFRITEGPRVQLGKIKFYGILSRDEKFYSNFILNNQPENSLVSKKTLVRQNIYLALEKLLSYMHNKGWVEAKIISVKFTYNNKKTKANVLVTLQEGIPFRVGNIKIVGNRHFSEEPLLYLMSTKINGIFDIEKLDKDINKITKHYHELGFLDMRFTKSIKDMTSYDRNKINITLQIDEGLPAYVKDIIIKGNHLTKESVILREISFKKGELLNSRKINKSIDRLQNLNLFSYVKINLKKINENIKSKYRTVIISVIEASPGIFNFGLGINNLYGLTLKTYTSMSYNNLYGMGEGFSGKLQTSYSLYDIYFLEKEASVSYLEPYFLNYSIKGRVSLSYEELITDHQQKLITINNRFLSSLEKEFDKNTRLIWNVFELEILEFYYLDRSSLREHETIGSIGPLLEINYLDNIFSPKKGFLTTFKIKYSNPAFFNSSGIHFLKLTSRYVYHWNFVPEFIWSNTLGGGYLVNLAKEKENGVPYDTEGFFLGGTSTVRGFNLGIQGERFPRRSELLGSENANSRKSFTLETDSYYGLLRSEFKYAVWEPIYSSLFYDGGFVLVRGKEFSDPYRDSIGLGVSYNTVFGAINFQFAKKLDRKKELHEDPYVFHFSIGAI